MKVRFAVSVSAAGPNFGEQVATVVTSAEQAGFDTVWFSDLPVLPAVDPILAVATAAALTRRVKLGVNVVPFGYRPYVIARQLAQLDQLSRGRLLVTLVPGLDQPGERAALGTAGAHRGRLIDELIPQLRNLWSGGSFVEKDSAGDDAAALAVLPLQDPLEIWLGGSGPEAVTRAGRLADGWLGSLVAPERARAIREAINREAARSGRAIDPEHFGLSVAYARDPSDLDRAVRIRRKVPVDLSEVVPVGRDALRSLIGQLTGAGLSKFVIRRVAPVELWSEELEWLAGAVLDLQT